MRHDIVDLSHPLRHGMPTHPGLPGPECSVHVGRDTYESAYGTTFQIDRVTLVGNTGTYLDSPFHRFADGPDLAGVDLARTVDLPVHVVRSTGTRAVDLDAVEARLGPLRLEGCAVLLHTGGDAGWGSDAYAEDAPYLTGAAAQWLAARAPALVGIDSVNVDALEDVSRPAHTTLLGAGVLVLEHLTALAELPDEGARLHAAPPAWHGLGTWTVRAYALVPTQP